MTTIDKSDFDTKLKPKSDPLFFFFFLMNCKSDSEQKITIGSHRLHP